MKHKPKGGFTIVELIVAIVVGSIICSAAIMLVVSHLHLSQQSRDIVLANAFVENKVESLRSIGYSGLSDGTTDITSELPTELNQPKSGSQVITSESDGLKRVVISVTYNDQGANRTYSYTTFVGELGVGQY